MKNKLEDINRVFINAFIVIITLLLIESCKEIRDKRNSSFSHHCVEIKKEYYQNGLLKEVGAIVDSIKQGYWLTYDSVGRLESECVYVDDIFNGPFTLYYPNGKIMVEGFMLDSAWIGKRIYYYVNGNIKEIGFYENGNMDSVWTTFDENGSIDKKIIYKNNKIEKIIEDNKITPVFP